jgi:hypothetical protein
LWFLLTHTNPGVLLNSFEAIPYLFMGNRSWPLSDTKNRDFVRRYELYFAIFSLVGLISAFRWFITQHNKKKIFTRACCRFDLGPWTHGHVKKHE